MVCSIKLLRVPYLSFAFRPVKALTAIACQKRARKVNDVEGTRSKESEEEKPTIMRFNLNFSSKLASFLFGNFSCHSDFSANPQVTMLFNVEAAKDKFADEESLQAA